MSFLELMRSPWPWYVAGPLIGLTVPLLLILGNKSFGVSSSLRHICAAAIPARIPFFQYHWKRETWNLLFVAGIIAGAALVSAFFDNQDPMKLNPDLINDLRKDGIDSFTGTIPTELFNWRDVLSPRGFVLMCVGGFLVGFGARYAGGCTSGHSITGLAMRQWPSLVATICFMIGGFAAANLIIPNILKW